MEGVRPLILSGSWLGMIGIILAGKSGPTSVSCSLSWPRGFRPPWFSPWSRWFWARPSSNSNLAGLHQRALLLRVDGPGLLFACVASVLWIATSLYAIGYMRGLHEHAQTRFYSYFALSLSATMGVAFSANLLTIYFFYEMLSVSTSPWSLTCRTRRPGREEEPPRLPAFHLSVPPASSPELVLRPGSTAGRSPWIFSPIPERSVPSLR